MTEQTPQGDGQRRVEIGIDGKPFEVWEPAPLPGQGVPQGQGGWTAAPGAPYTPAAMPGSYYPRGPAETAMLETPRTSMELNHYAWYSLGLGGFAFIGAVIGWAFNGAGMPWYVGIGFAGVGAYFGMRSHNAGLRGFCTNGRLGLAGIALSVVAALGIVGFIVRASMRVATVVQGG